MRLYGYLSDDESQMLAYEAVADHKIMAINNELDKLFLEHRINMMAADTKVLLESGTDDDLTTLYIAEAEETAKKGKGLLSRLCSFIGNLFKRLKNWLFKKAPDGSEDKEVNARASDLQQRSNSCFSVFKNILVGAASTVGGAFLGTIAKNTANKISHDVIDPIIDATRAKLAVNKAENVKKKVYKVRAKDVAKEYEDHKHLIDFCTKQIAEMEKAIKSAEEKKLTPEAIDKLKDILNEIKGIYTEASEAVGKLTTKDDKDGTKSDSSENNKDDKQDGKSSENAGFDSRDADIKNIENAEKSRDSANREQQNSKKKSGKKNTEVMPNDNTPNRPRPNVKGYRGPNPSLCDNCGTRNSPDAKKCSNCGAILKIRVKKCPICGRLYGLSHTACIKCSGTSAANGKRVSLGNDNITLVPSTTKLYKEHAMDDFGDNLGLDELFEFFMDTD